MVALVCVCACAAAIVLCFSRILNTRIRILANNIIIPRHRGTFMPMCMDGTYLSHAHTFIFIICKCLFVCTIIKYMSDDLFFSSFKIFFFVFVWKCSSVCSSLLVLNTYKKNVRQLAVIRFTECIHTSCALQKKSFVYLHFFIFLYLYEYSPSFCLCLFLIHLKNI